MKINYDSKIDAEYIKIKPGKVYNTKPVTDWLLFDYNKKGDVIAVEVLDVHKHRLVISTDGSNFLGYEIMDEMNKEIEILNVDKSKAQEGLDLLDVNQMKTLKVV